MNYPNETTAYWKVFHTIRTSRYIHLIGEAIPRLLHQYQLLFGSTLEYLSLKEYYEERLNKHKNKS